MKGIVNTGFGLKPAGIEIVKNEQRIMYSPMKKTVGCSARTLATVLKSD